jgi:hypothetical protein
MHPQMPMHDIMDICSAVLVELEIVSRAFFYVALENRERGVGVEGSSDIV